jgi:AcrR family transcriptional regulator
MDGAVGRRVRKDDAHRREDPRSEGTRAALIQEAEILFAQSGVDGVSLRQIAAAIGSSNSNVVSYHFGTKDALVMEIFRQRLRKVDARRAALLSIAENDGGADNLVILLDILCRPLLEQVDREGSHSYAAFIDGVIRSGRLPLRATVAPEFAATNALSARIAVACGALPGHPRFILRLHLSLSILTAALQAMDKAGSRDDRQDADLYAQAVKMMAAALLAGSGEKMEGDGSEA